MTGSAEEGEIPPIQGCRSRGVLLLDEPSFCDWLAQALPGHRIAYYLGIIAHDRVPSTSVLSEPERRALVAVAGRVLQVAQDGRIAPVQQRLHQGGYAYIATRIQHRPKVEARPWRP